MSYFFSRANGRLATKTNMLEVLGINIIPYYQALAAKSNDAVIGIGNVYNLDGALIPYSNTIEGISYNGNYIILPQGKYELNWTFYSADGGQSKTQWVQSSSTDAMIWSDNPTATGSQTYQNPNESALGTTISVIIQDSNNSGISILCPSSTTAGQNALVSGILISRIA